MSQYYRERIEQILREADCLAEYDARHIEAFMRLAHGTLNQLCTEEFRAEIAIAMDCIDVGGVSNAERLATTFDM